MQHTHTDHAHDEGLDPSEVPVDPAFEVKTRVKLRTVDDGRYKRRPDYAENAEGVITHVRGAYAPPEEPAGEPSEQPTHEFLYSVEFTHQDIWGADHPESNGSVVIDIWESALEDVS